MRGRTVFTEINITPLTDIFLVLLIIMMVVAPMLDYPGIKLAMPSVGPSPDTKTAPKTIALNIDAQNKMTVDNKPVSLLGLTLQLQQLKSSKPDGIVIQADPSSTHEALTQAMDAAQAAGIDKVAVVAGPDKQAGNPPENQNGQMQ